MIRLYRSLDFFDKKNVLYDNEAFFLAIVNVDEFYGEFLDIIGKIDHAELLDMNTGMIRTPFGVCSKDYLSNGCKTVLNLVYLYRHRDKYTWVEALNATECGINAINVLIEFLDKTGYDIGIIIEHGDGMYDCKKSHYMVDNKIETEEIGLEWLV